MIRTMDGRQSLRSVGGGFRPVRYGTELVYRLHFRGDRSLQLVQLHHNTRTMPAKENHRLKGRVKRTRLASRHYRKGVEDTKMFRQNRLKGYRTLRLYNAYALQYKAIVLYMSLMYLSV